MNKPRHQHFIPKSYLKNFFIEKDKNYFVEAKLKTEESPRSNLIYINVICVNRNLQAIPNIADESKYILKSFMLKKQTPYTLGFIVCLSILR